MIGLDTNVLIRYLVQDDPRQAKMATKLIEGKCSKQSPGRISLVVMCELVWVLLGAYRYPKKSVVAALGQLLITAELEVENEEVARLSLDAYRNGAADFADYVIGFSNKKAGCDVTYTFDHAFGNSRIAKSLH
ncbi:MAG: putative nucleic-acid-binding protein [Limisphaerales bacterium]